jgi:cell wall-associated NlpC family hydrolase
MAVIWIPPYGRDEVVARAISKIGDPGAPVDVWEGPALNCLRFVAWVYGYPLGNMRARVGEINSLWPQICGALGWRMRGRDEGLQAGDLLGLQFQFQWHVGVYVGNGFFVHALGKKISKSRLKYWRKNLIEALEFPEGRC